MVSKKFSQYNIVVLVDTIQKINWIKKYYSIPKWFCIEIYVINALKQLGHKVEIVPFNIPLIKLIEKLEGVRPDLVFNLVDSYENEDAKYSYAAVVLDILKIPFTGPYAKGLELSIDKGISKLIVSKAGYLCPEFQVLNNIQDLDFINVNYPIIVKPLYSGGSTGIDSKSVVDNKRQLRLKINNLWKKIDQPIICEEFIYGIDISVGLYKEVGLKIANILQWKFSETVKYPVVTEKIKWNREHRKKLGVQYSNAKLSRRLISRIKDDAINIFNLLQLKDYAAIDFRLTDKNELYFLEINANPGLTPSSLRWKGIDFSYLISCIIDSALLFRRTH